MRLHHEDALPTQLKQDSTSAEKIETQAFSLF